MESHEAAPNTFGTSFLLLGRRFQYLPKLKGSGTQSERYYFDIHVAGSYVYLTNNEGVGLRVFDISDPANPVEVGSYNTTNDTVAVDVSGSYEYLADRYDFIWARNGGIRIIDLLAGN